MGFVVKRRYNQSVSGVSLRHSAFVTSDDPDQQVADAIGLMSRYVREDWASPEIRADVAQAVGTSPDPVPRIFSFIKDRVRFLHDSQIADALLPRYQWPVVEVLIRPRDMSTLCASGECTRVGDCDDFAMYAAALLKAAGLKPAFVTVAADPQQPDRFSHVYVAAYRADGARVPVDVSHGHYPGWEAPNLGRIREWIIFPEIWPHLLALGIVAVLAWPRSKRGES